MRGATSALCFLPIVCMVISTHTPHAGRNSPVLKNLLIGDAISTHTPHAGRNLKCGGCAETCRQKFQLTRPMRGATGTHIAPIRIPIIHFNSHAPCGAQRSYLDVPREWLGISTHTPHAGRNYRIHYDT